MPHNPTVFGCASLQRVAFGLDTIGVRLCEPPSKSPHGLVLFGLSLVTITARQHSGPCLIASIRPDAVDLALDLAPKRRLSQSLRHG